jgi:hypothetical protein
MVMKLVGIPGLTWFAQILKMIEKPKSSAAALA